MRNQHFKIYCVIIICVITLPILCTMINYCSRLVVHHAVFQERELSGAISVPAKPELSVEAVLTRQFQTNFEKYLEYILASRKTFTRVYNQLLYSVFRSTDNKEILVGREDYLFEKPYPAALLIEMTAEEKTDLEQKIDRLAELGRRLKARGVTLVVRMSPSKAEYYSEYLPVAYSRFIKMKENGAYAPNWRRVFLDKIAKVDIPFYDCHDFMQKLKEEGEITFTKGGTHWSLSPMAGYINGLNAYMEGLIHKKLGRLVVTSEQVINGQMGSVDDSDIWNLCWNAVSVKPNYPSPNITFQTIPGNATIRVFTVGQSFTTGLVNTIYSTTNPVWEETYFSWYDSRVLMYNSETPTGIQISDTTEDFEQYLNMDVILIEFLENGTGETQFEFVDHMLQYLDQIGAQQ